MNGFNSGNTLSEVRYACRKLVLFKTLLLSLSLLAAPAAFAVSLQLDSQQQTQVENDSNRQQVDINSADAATLALALDGIGAAKAREIVEHREKNGDFKSVDQLAEVNGIGKATIERNRSRILIREK